MWSLPPSSFGNMTIRFLRRPEAESGEAHVVITAAKRERPEHVPCLRLLLEPPVLSMFETDF